MVNPDTPSIPQVTSGMQDIGGGEPELSKVYAPGHARSSCIHMTVIRM